MRRAVVAGFGAAAVGAAGVIVAAFVDARHLAFAWLAAFGWGVSLALGALIVVMVLHVTRARWAVVFLPTLTAMAATLPLFALLFVPVVLGLRVLYPWAGDIARFEPSIRHALEHQRSWNNPPLFLARAAIYLATWSVLGVLLRRAHVVYERGPSSAGLARQRTVSAVGLPVVGFTLCFASFDWLMSVQPGWVSNMYGVLVFASGFSAALAALVVIAFLARRAGILPEAVGPDHFHAIGRLVLVAVIFWGYIAFFFLMLVWIGNLPREVSFFVDRAWATTPSGMVPILVVRFFVPFFLLLSRSLKRSPAWLCATCAWLVVMSLVDFAWLVLPSAVGAISVLDFAPVLVVAGLAWACGAWVFFGAEAVPRLDPALDDALRYHSP